MFRVLKVLLITITVMFVSSCGGGDGRLTIVYSGNLDGELEPCGCSPEGDLGGILRRGTKLAELRKETPNLFAFSTGGLIASMSPQDRLTGEYILKGFSQFNYDAVSVQWNDLAYGKAFIQNDKLPWVSSNWLGEEFLPVKTVKRGGFTLAFFSWLDPDSSPMAAMKGQHENIELDHDVEKLRKALSKAQASGAITLLSTTLPLEKAKQTLPLDVVNILFIKSAYEEFGEPQVVDGTLVLQPGSRGMRLGRVDIDIANGKIENFQHQVLTMPSTVANAEWLLPWYEEYNAKVKESYLKRVELRKAQRSGQSPYVGEETCQTCHAEEHKIWSGTRHSGAFGKLENVNKAFDPNCIGCHTVGFEKEGGYIDFDATPHLMNVQCESCHGVGRVHAESGGKQPLGHSGWKPQQMCAQCHNPKHSPSFVFEKYWPKIKHGTKYSPVK